MGRDVDGEIAREFVVQLEPAQVALTAVQPEQWFASAADGTLDARASYRHKFPLECRHLRFY
jgi:hypothetical protein